MHEYIEIQFRRNDKPYRIKRQVSAGFEFVEADPPTRTIDVGFAPFDDGTRYRMAHIRQVKGWEPQEFRLRLSVEDGSLVIRGDDEYSLPEGFYDVTAKRITSGAPEIAKRRLVHAMSGITALG